MKYAITYSLEEAWGQVFGSLSHGSYQSTKENRHWFSFA
jgi:hypothetical protein